MNPATGQIFLKLISDMKNNIKLCAYELRPVGKSVFGEGDMKDSKRKESFDFCELCK